MFFCSYKTIVFVQVLYQFIFCMGEVTQPFTIFDSFPRAQISPSAVTTLDDSAIPSGCLLSVEWSDSPDPFDLLQVCFIMNVLTL